MVEQSLFRKMHDSKVTRNKILLSDYYSNGTMIQKGCFSNKIEGNVPNNMEVASGQDCKCP